MSGKELSKLVAFVKGVQFDLVDYLQRERYGCAQLENFASGHEIHRMETLQSRLDAEFLLSHMRSVKFKEWIVVLATLLRRPEWQAVSQTRPYFIDVQGGTTTEMDSIVQWGPVHLDLFHFLELRPRLTLGLVLYDLFHHDNRLWKAYSITLQSHPSFAEYHDLLEVLQERLSPSEIVEEL